MVFVVAALLACKGGGANDGTYVGACTTKTHKDVDLDLPHEDCKLTIAGSSVKLELKIASSEAYARFQCSGSLKDDKVDGTCSVLDGRGGPEVPHCLENHRYEKFVVQKRGDKMHFEVVVRGTASESRCPPDDAKLSGYDLAGDLAKK